MEIFIEKIRKKVYFILQIIKCLYIWDKFFSIKKNVVFIYNNKYENNLHINFLEVRKEHFK